MPLRQWLWRSYLRSAIIPLLVIELSFVLVYWVSNALIYRENLSTIGGISEHYLNDLARREALSVSSQLTAINRLTQMLALQTGRALQGDYQPPESEKARYAFTPQGAFYTRNDNGTTASLYTGVHPVGPEQVAKVWHLAALDPLMMDISHSQPVVAAVYVNTHDSYNRIYPYIDVLQQYPQGMDITTFNFYYLADARHNPKRGQVWTDAYLDPAGNGWMVTSAAPVWIDEKLEAVVGIDVTLETMIRRLQSLELPWGGYAMLVDAKGGILAMPPGAERDLRLRELTSADYADTVRADTLKPERFNIASHKNTSPLARAMRKDREGVVELDMGGPSMASFATIDGTGWRLVVVAPKSTIYADAESLRRRTTLVGITMLLALLLFYLVFLVALRQRARSMSRRVAEPVSTIQLLMDRIGAGEFNQQFDGSQVAELDELGRKLVDTGKQLGAAREKILEQEQVVKDALRHEREVNERQSRFVRFISHEVRTPLAIIDSAAQIMDRKAETIEPADLQARSARIRTAVARIAGLIKKLGTSAAEDDDA